MNNGQSAASNLSNEQIQLFLTARLGDGYIAQINSGKCNYRTNCKYKEYINYKIQLLGNLYSSQRCISKNGYAQTPIYEITSKSVKEISYFKTLSLSDILNQLTDLGIALWFYDDGSLHKSKLFYNLNTQKFSKEKNEQIAEYFKQKWNIIAIPTIERKKDGRQFWYLRIRKYEGAFMISEILNKYYVNCYNYKIISSETIQKWSKLQEKLKSNGKNIFQYNARQLSNMLKKIIL